jgi:signal transduction histidine kinase
VSAAWRRPKSARIARDLHDSAGHAINVVLVHAGPGRLRAESDPDGAREAFATIEEVARETVGDIDQMVRVLREDGSTPGGDEVEPPAGLAALGGLVERHRAAGLDVAARVRGERRPLPQGVEQGAYRILQGGAHQRCPPRRWRRGGRRRLRCRCARTSVANGLRRGPAGSVAGGGHGIVGMRERASMLGGSLEAGARNGRFQLHARLPLAGDRA